jgi:lambda repressor-like predicted transcriptional regulator
MARPAAPRLPFADLERLVAARLGVKQSGGHHGWTDADMACVFRLSVDALQQVRSRATLGLDAADRLAIAAGYHPAEVWPQWWELVEQVDGERTERAEADRLRRRERERNRVRVRSAA